MTARDAAEREIEKTFTIQNSRAGVGFAIYQGLRMLSMSILALADASEESNGQ